MRRLLVILGLVIACAHEPAAAPPVSTPPAPVSEPPPPAPTPVRKSGRPPVSPAPTPGRDFIATLPRCAADLSGQPVDEIKPEQIGRPVAVRGTLSITSWASRKKDCSGPNGEKVCCNYSLALWLVAPPATTAGRRNSIGFTLAGSRGPSGLGAWDCHTAEISRSTPQPEVVVSGVLAPGDVWEYKFLVTDARVCVTDGPPVQGGPSVQ